MLNMPSILFSLPNGTLIDLRWFVKAWLGKRLHNPELRPGDVPIYRTVVFIGLATFKENSVEEIPCASEDEAKRLIHQIGNVIGLKTK